MLYGSGYDGCATPSIITMTVDPMITARKPLTKFLILILGIYEPLLTIVDKLRLILPPQSFSDDSRKVAHTGRY